MKRAIVFFLKGFLVNQGKATSVAATSVLSGCRASCNFFTAAPERLNENEQAATAVFSSSAAVAAELVAELPGSWIETAAVVALDSAGSAVPSSAPECGPELDASLGKIGSCFGVGGLSNGRDSRQRRKGF